MGVKEILVVCEEVGELVLLLVAVVMSVLDGEVVIEVVTEVVSVEVIDVVRVS